MLEEGFHRPQIFPSHCNLKNIRHDLQTKLEERYPHLREMVKVDLPEIGSTYLCKNQVEAMTFVYLGGDHLYTRKHLDELTEHWLRIEEKLPRVVERYQRLLDWMMAENKRILLSLPKDEALELLKSRDTAPYHWYEVLPIGIEEKFVSDYFEIDFCVDEGWVGNKHVSVQYSPKRNPKKHTIFAKKL